MKFYLFAFCLCVCVWACLRALQGADTYRRSIMFEPEVESQLWSSFGEAHTWSGLPEDVFGMWKYLQPFSHTFFSTCSWYRCCPYQKFSQSVECAGGIACFVYCTSTMVDELPLIHKNGCFSLMPILPAVSTKKWKTKYSRKEHQWDATYWVRTYMRKKAEAFWVWICVQQSEKINMLDCSLWLPLTVLLTHRLNCKLHRFRTLCLCVFICLSNRPYGSCFSLWSNTPICLSICLYVCLSVYLFLSIHTNTHRPG